MDRPTRSTTFDELETDGEFDSDVFNVQGALPSPNMLLTVVYSQSFHIKPSIGRLQGQNRTKVSNRPN